MAGLGTIVNCLSVVFGTVVGIFFKKNLSQAIKEVAENSISIVLILIGITGAVSNMIVLNQSGALERINLIRTILFLVIGGIVGTLLDIDGKLNFLGEKLSGLVSSNNSTLFTKAFAISTIFCCCGAMSVVGTLEEGLTGIHITLFAKSVLDGIMSVVLAATLGIGVGFGALSVLVYQGILTVLAVFMQPIATDMVLTQVSVIGSIVISCIGFNMLKATNIKVANLLVAVYLPLLLELILQLKNYIL